MYLTEVENYDENGRGKGCFEKMLDPGEGHYWGSFVTNGLRKYHIGLIFNSSFVAPTRDESAPIGMTVSAMLRVS